jgi:hypothetical protein
VLDAQRLAGETTERGTRDVRVCAHCDEQTMQIQTKRSTRRYRLRLMDGESISGNEWELQHDRVSTGVDVLLANRAIDHIDIWEKRASFVLFSSAQIARARQKQSAGEKKRASLVQSGLLDEARRNVGMGGRHRFLRLLHVGIGRAPVQQSALRPERPQRGSLRSLCVSPLSLPSLLSTLTHVRAHEWIGGSRLQNAGPPQGCSSAYIASDVAGAAKASFRNSRGGRLPDEVATSFAFGTWT